MKKKIWKQITAFLLAAVIIAQSGMTAFATEDIPGEGKAEEYVSGQEEITQPQETAAPEMTPEATEEPEETATPEVTPETTMEPEETATPEMTPEATEEPEETATPEMSPEATADPEETMDPEQTPGEILPEETPTPEMEEMEETPTPSVTPEVTMAPQMEPEDLEIIWLESRLQEEAPVENLTKEQIFELDERLAEFAEGISPVIETEGNKIVFLGEIEYAEGYYLAFRINPDKEYFTQEGTIQIEYTPEGENQEIVRYEAPEDVYEKGFWDVIIPLPEDSLKLVVTVDNDGNDEAFIEEKMSALKEIFAEEGIFQEEEISAEDAADREEIQTLYERYAPGIYEIDLSGLQKTAVETNILNGALPAEQAAITNMTAPTIKSVTTRDTSAVVTFVPNDIVRWEGSEKGNGYYTITLTEKVTGEIVEAQDITWPEEGEEGAQAACVYKFIAGDNTVKTPLYTCEITGLSSNKAYTLVITAHYGEGDSKLEKSSKSMAFTTKKEMLTGGGSLDVSYIKLDDLWNDPDANGAKKVDYEAGIEFENNQTFALMAEVSNLSRALETEKITWAVLTEQGKAANKKDYTLKTGASVFEAQLTIKTPGTYKITATSTVNKEKLSEFFVNVPEEGGDAAGISLQSELFYFYERDEKISLYFEEDGKGA